MLDSMIYLIGFAHLDSVNPEKTVPPLHPVAGVVLRITRFSCRIVGRADSQTLRSDMLDWASQKDYGDKQSLRRKDGRPST